MDVGPMSLSSNLNGYLLAGKKLLLPITLQEVNMNVDVSVKYLKTFDEDLKAHNVLRIFHNHKVV